MPADGDGIRIFLSYRRDDTSGHAGRLYDQLVTRFSPAQVFMDLDTIRPGTDFSRAIERALDDCDVMLALIGATWSTRTGNTGLRRLDDPTDFVRMELGAALRRESVVVIPLLVQNAEMPSVEELPEELRALARRQALELSDSRWRSDVSRLIDTLGEVRRPTTAHQRPRWVVAMLGLAGVLLIATAVTVAVSTGLVGGGGSAGTLEAAIRVGDGPTGIDEGGGYVWTANSGGTVSRIDPADGSVREIAVGGEPKDLKAGSGAVWVWNYANAVTRIDMASETVAPPVVSTEGPISGLALGDGVLWTTHGPDGRLSRLDATTGKPAGSPVSLGTKLGGTAFADHRLYVLETDAQALVVVDGDTGAVLSNPLQFHRPLGGLIVVQGVVYVGSTDSITPVDQVTFVMGDPLPVKGAGGFDVGGGSVWATYPLENVTRRFDLTTAMQVGDPVPGVGRGLEQTLFASGVLWATHPSDDTVIRIRPS